jgi:hypothetical protein
MRGSGRNRQGFSPRDFSGQEKRGGKFAASV